MGQPITLLVLGGQIKLKTDSGISCVIFFFKKKISGFSKLSEVFDMNTEKNNNRRRKYM